MKSISFNTQDLVSLAFTALSKLDPSDPNFAVIAIDTVIPIAIDRGASDIHMQPRLDGWEVLFRIDGVLSVADFLPGGGDSDPVTRLMVLADLPTYRSSHPMEGRLGWSGAAAQENNVTMRLGVYPTVHGPRAVVRLLRHQASHESIDSLGMPGDVGDVLKELTGNTDGAILMSGPAGSGKTTTMYAMLRHIASASPRRSVMTIEDPVETVIDSISQSELDPGGGMTLASALRSAVRQDSEVLLVSEIRDPETAEAALQASLTGHLVFSSLHATDVAASLRRLIQLGVPSFVVRSGVRAIVAQRLLRRVCRECHRDTSDNETECVACSGTGYRGRVAITQIVRLDGSDPVGEMFADLMEANASVGKMRSAAREAGGVDLWSQAQRFVDDGVTDEAEVYRVLGRRSPSM